MNYDILNNKPLEFYNESGELMGHMFVSSSSGNLHIAATSGSEADVIIGNQDTVGDVEIGLPSAPVNLKLMGGGTLTSNGNTLNIGNPDSGDTVVINSDISSIGIASEFTWFMA